MSDRIKEVAKEIMELSKKRDKLNEKIRSYPMDDVSNEILDMIREVERITTVLASDAMWIAKEILTKK